MKDDEFLEFINSKEWKEYKLEMNKRGKNSKNGPDVIHFEYFGSLFSERDFIEYEHKLKEVGLHLSRFDKSGVWYNSLEKFELISFITINQPIIEPLLIGIGSNITWDTIKLLATSIWKKIRNKSYNKVSLGKSEKKEITFGLKVHLDNNTSFNMSLKGDVEEAIIQRSLDQVLNFLKEQKPNEQYKLPYFVQFDTQSNTWTKTDVEEEIRQMIEKERNDML